jgi:hypothetical protein
MAGDETNAYLEWLDEWRAADARRSVVVESTPSGWTAVMYFGRVDSVGIPETLDIGERVTVDAGRSDDGGFNLAVQCAIGDLPVALRTLHEWARRADV